MGHGQRWRGLDGRKGCRLLGAALVLGALAACGMRSPGVARYPEFAEFEGRRITDVRFTGQAPFAPDTLQSLIQTEPSRCNFLGLPICVPFTRIGRQTQHLNLAVLGRDVDRLTNFYRRKSYFGTTVAPDIESTGDDVRVTFRIDRADPVVLTALDVTGTEGIVEPATLAAQLPLQPGHPFDLDRFNRSGEVVLSELRGRGHAYAELLRNYTVNALALTAVASLDAVPGPRVMVDSIIIFGADNLGRRATLQQLPFRQGDVLDMRRLIEGHRNLYNLEIVQLATVRVAPDTLQVVPEDSSRVTVEVRIAEAPPRQVDAAIGYGTVECFRAEGQWVNRSFFGGARRLAVRGHVSRIGIGEPLDAGLAGLICRRFRPDPAAPGEESLDYRFAADFTQPYFASPRNHLSVGGFAERVSEPLVFEREAIGARTALTRRLATRTVLTGALDLERGRTVAFSPALYCVAFLVCEPEVIADAQRTRFKNALDVQFVRDRTDVLTDPTRGNVLRSGMTWSPDWLGSDFSYLRWTAEFSVYREIRARWVGALSVRVGNFFRTADLVPSRRFVPPEERFFAGGATTVRGFERNALGAGVYVQSRPFDPDTEERAEARFVPVGGTSLAVANAELRFPAPVLSNILRLAVFVDAGAVGEAHVWQLADEDWRVTPGIGLRLHTPVGPIRFDMGFNPYDPPAGPLFAPELDPETGTPTGGLIRIEESFRPRVRGLFDRLRIHVGIGQAF